MPLKMRPSGLGSEIDKDRQGLAGGTSAASTKPRRPGASALVLVVCRSGPPTRSDRVVHGIKHDAYRLMARRDPVGIRLLTRRGNDWANRFPLVVETLNHLKVRSCLIDREVVCCDERGVAIFSTLLERRDEASAFLYAFDLLEFEIFGESQSRCAKRP